MISWLDQPETEKTMKNSYNDLLKTSSLGQMLGEEICDDIMIMGHLKTHKPDSIIFQEEDDSSGIWIVLEGMVKLTRYTEDGREVIIHLAESGRIIAEASLFIGKYPATAVAVENSKVLLIYKENVFQLMDKYPQFLRHIFDSMAGWLNRLVSKINQLTLNDATARVVNYLFNLDGEQHSDGRKKGQIKLPVKKGELAKLLNMKQGSLSRVFRRLQDESLIVVDGREIVLKNEEELNKLLLPPLD